MRKGWDGFLSQWDIALANLAITLSSEHKVIECLPDLFSFNRPTIMLGHLARCSIALSILNNHRLDQGVVGLFNTIKELDARKILHAGACANTHGQEYSLIRENGSTVAVLAYAWGLNRGKDRVYRGPVRLNLLNLCDTSKHTDYFLVEEHIKRVRAEHAELIICSSTVVMSARCI